MTSSWHIPFWMAWASVCLGGRCPRVLQVSLAHLERQKVRALEVTLALHMGHLSLMHSRFCLEGGRKDRQVVALFKISEGGRKNRVIFQRCGPWPGHVTATCTPPGGTARPRFPRSQKPPLRSGMRPRGTCRRSDNKAVPYCSDTPPPSHQALPSFREDAGPERAGAVTWDLHTHSLLCHALAV